MKLNYYYDKEADVFYFSLGKPKPAISEETADDVIIRRDAKTGQVVGFTVLNFSRRSQRSSQAVELPIDISMAAAA